ncbi:unnamed protein product [Didymodactylos carnosus]|uniref:Uncharacterized protein n=1 Tax=Didymodactylos carnosus TaxID=1234261 RepID=A0A814JWW9_9BILA|nr:unnamed protein product [Didymodactylos carnosus]CAF3814305.1 unnamed protein product [Didymodactylos carnosus]
MRNISIDETNLITKGCLSITANNCNECLCKAYQNTHVILFTCNSFSSHNVSCTLYCYAPASQYFIHTTNASSVYVIRYGQNCCNWSWLIEQINNAINNTVRISEPRFLALDDDGNIITTSKYEKLVVKYNPNNLTEITRSHRLDDPPVNVGYYKQHYYVGFENKPMEIFNSTFHKLDGLINDGGLKSPLTIAFRNDTMFICTQIRDIVLYDVKDPKNIREIEKVEVKEDGVALAPRGLLIIDNTNFYTASFDSNNIKIYSKSGAGSWTFATFIQAHTDVKAKNVTDFRMDDCGRVWIVDEGFHHIKIFQGDDLIGTITGLNEPFNLLILKNYVLIITQKSGEIIRIDPRVSCNK